MVCGFTIRVTVGVVDRLPLRSARRRSTTAVAGSAALSYGWSPHADTHPHGGAVGKAGSSSSDPGFGLAAAPVVGDIDGLRGYRQRGLTLMSTTQIPTKTTPLTTPRQECDTHPAGGPR